MKKLTVNEIEKIDGGCDPFFGVMAIGFSTIGVVGYWMGPAGWPAAVLSSLIGVGIARYCS
jgi:hypothetical protein